MLELTRLPPAHHPELTDLLAFLQSRVVSWVAQAQIYGLELLTGTGRRRVLDMGSQWDGSETYRKFPRNVL